MRKLISATALALVAGCASGARQGGDGGLSDFSVGGDSGGHDLAKSDFSMASCTDGIKDGNETDVDCGGPSCPPCAVGKMCTRGMDCVSGSCVALVCAGPTCSDGIQNGLETDVDCGGGTCPTCANGKKCKVVADCQSTMC